MGKRVLVVVDMQKDFVDGSLGSKEAVSIVPAVVKKARDFDGTVLFTRDTHGEDYLLTQEGRKLPVEHCIRGSHGWKISSKLDTADSEIIDKPTFGSYDLIERLEELDQEDALESVELVGLCTDICVISNAMLVKNRFPELQVMVDAECCAGVMPETHTTALKAMDLCQVEILHGHAGESEE